MVEPRRTIPLVEKLLVSTGAQVYLSSSLAQVSLIREGSLVSR